jgi:hypothetical protein
LLEVIDLDPQSREMLKRMMQERKTQKPPER